MRGERERAQRASFVVVSWARPNNIAPILRRATEQSFVAEAVVWDNSADTPNWRVSEWLGCGRGDCPVRVMGVGRNLLLMGRFEAVRAAACDWIATQDDDVLVENWPELWREASGRPGQVTANMFRDEDDALGGRIRVRTKGGPKVECEDVWLGYGSVFHRRLVGDVFDRYRARWGEDDVLLRDADRVFCVALGRSHHAVQARVVKLPGIDGPESLHKQPDGAAKTRLARRRAVELAAGRADRLQ